MKRQRGLEFPDTFLPSSICAAADREMDAVLRADAKRRAQVARLMAELGL